MERRTKLIPPVLLITSPTVPVFLFVTTQGGSSTVGPVEIVGALVAWVVLAFACTLLID